MTFFSLGAPFAGVLEVIAYAGAYLFATAVARHLVRRYSGFDFMCETCS